MKNQITDWFKGLQDTICKALEKEDENGQFHEDKWERPGGGGGRTRIIYEGNVIEKGGVNFSAVEGKTPQVILNALNLDQADFFATGVSIVIHPNSPMVPIIHMNVRYFEMSNGTWWFGGGIDLTPHYVNEEDAKFFHNSLKQVCDKHHPSYYPKFKQWADDYFYIKHRKETRGVGGIFFDRLSEKEELSKEAIFEFVKDVGNEFAPIYTHLMNKNKRLPFNETQKQWQLLRRGRYVEFNLVYDKGTKFGLDTDGRTESILMSLPSQANWTYNHQVEKNSAEEKTLSLLTKGVNWADI
ncbi:MAG: oxygen-dependent coproporphyrinogen oxidase [Cyclobacteriaceae bacterium]|nr:oxygen-dependent coproporphyrinogen oxidase [Cyclobacteriaceae bacterium]